MRIENHLLTTTSVPEDVLVQIIERSAVLWVGENGSGEQSWMLQAAKLAVLPWKAVIWSPWKKSAVSALEAEKQNASRYNRFRGFVQLIATSSREEKPVGMPIYLPNGREDADYPEASTKLTSIKAAARTNDAILNVMETLPRTLVVLFDPSRSNLPEVLTSWGEDNYRPQVVVVDPLDGAEPLLSQWLALGPGLGAVTRVVMPLEKFTAELQQGVDRLLPDQRMIVRIRGNREADVSNCDVIETSIFDGLELLDIRAIRPRGPDELTEELMNRFFASGRVWEAYAAGLPWQGNRELEIETLKALSEVEKHGSTSNSIVILPAEAGSGGTTLACMAGFAAAKLG